MTLVSDGVKLIRLRFQTTTRQRKGWQLVRSQVVLGILFYHFVKVKRKTFYDTRLGLLHVLYNLKATGYPEQGHM